MDSFSRCLCLQQAVFHGTENEKSKQWSQGSQPPKGVKSGETTPKGVQSGESTTLRESITQRNISFIKKTFLSSFYQHIPKTFENKLKQKTIVNEYFFK